MKNFFRYLSLVIAMLLTVGGLSTLAIREQVLKPDVYNQALNQAGVYPAIEDILVTKTAAYIETAAKQVVAQLSNQINPQREAVARLEPLAVWYLNDLVSRQTTPLVAEAAKNLQVTNNMQALTEQGVNYTVGWLAGTQPDPKFMAYIPEPEQLEAVKTEGAIPFVARQLKTEMGLEDLPPCESALEGANNLRLITSGRANEINCQSEEIRMAIARTAQVIKPQIAKTQLAITLESYVEKYQIKTLVDNVFEAVMDLSVFKQELMTFKANLALVEQQAQRALWGSLIFLAIGLVLTEKKRLRTLFLTYMWVGILMLVSAGGYTVAASQAVARAMPDRLIKITDPAISVAQNERLAKALETAVILVVEDWVTSVKFLGGAITALSLLGLLIVHLLSKNQEKKAAKRKLQPELFDEVAVTETKPTKTTASKKKTKAKKK